MFSEISKKKLKNGGFSLIELIIVVAIMVALIVVMAPAYVKYVQKSRDAVITNAAEEVIEFAKSEYTSGTLTGSATVTVGGDASNKVAIVIESDTNNPLAYDGITGDAGCNAFIEACGGETNKNTASDLVYTISLNGSDATKLDVSFDTNRDPV